MTKEKSGSGIDQEVGADAPNQQQEPEPTRLEPLPPELELARSKDEPTGRVLMLTDPEAMRAFERVFTLRSER